MSWQTRRAIEAAIEDDAIAAPATVDGAAPLALVRLSGRDVLEQVAPLLILADPSDLAPRRPCAIELRWSPSQPPVPAVALLFAAGASYTGEAMLEIYLPGCPAIVRRFIETLRECGVRAATPGEFTRRAFLNGRLDLTQAEAVAMVIAAEDVTRARAAQRVLAGRLGERVTSVGDALHRLIALLEAGLDFSEQEVEPPDPATIRLEIDAIRAQLSRLFADAELSLQPTAQFRIAIAGQSNAGKSTLFNALCGRPQSIISDVPGTTRDVVRAAFGPASWPVVELLDLPGERSEAEGAERTALELAEHVLNDADLVLYAFDATRPGTALAAEWSKWPEVLKSNTWIIMTKIDAAPTAVATAEFGAPSFLVSARTGAGLAGLWAALDRALLGGAFGARGDSLLFTTRQLGELTRARDALEQLDAQLGAAALAQAPMLPELVVIDLRAAHSCLVEITGAITTEDTLDRIFAEFCLGK
ncbi:MAG: tRNA modification GTPase [Planctomycetota bacterium]